LPLRHRRLYTWLMSAKAGEALAALADKAASYDADGIDVFFLNNKEAVGRGLRVRVCPALRSVCLPAMQNSAGVNALFKTVRPLRTTPIGARLEDLLRKYLADLERADRQGDELPKPLNIIIITDGIPSALHRGATFLLYVLTS
jgi:hypothetical protein